MINPALNVVKLAESFRRNKSIQISDFLKEEEATKLYDWLNGGMPEDWWFTSVHNPLEKDYKGATNIRNKPEARELINIKIKEANEAFLNGSFSYVFDRTTAHAAKCDCLECQFLKFLKNEFMLFFVKSVTGTNVKKTNEVFSSRFLSNFFLSPHHDKGKGKIGFVYSLSRFWRPEWGGNLHFMEDDYKTVTETIVPVFNKLTLFDIPSKDGVPHYVSHVVPSVETKRLSITGWFE
jgi:hypothetical protein